MVYCRMSVGQLYARVENRHSIPAAGWSALIMDFSYISKIHFLVRKRVKPIRFKCVISISAAEVTFCFAFEISIDDSLLSMIHCYQCLNNERPW